MTQTKMFSVGLVGTTSVLKIWHQICNSDQK
jgi:hypothetical protein